MELEKIVLWIAIVGSAYVAFKLAKGIINFYKKDNGEKN
jgi:hypothetical protein